MYFNGEKIYTDKNFHFGGTNLLSGTHDFDGFSNYLNLQESYDFFGNKQSLSENSWSTPRKLIQVFANQIVCFSAVVQAKSKDYFPILGIYGGDAGAGTAITNNSNMTYNNTLYVDNGKAYSDDANDATKAFTPNDLNQHIVYGFFQITQTGIFNPRVESSNHAPWLVSSYKLELGTIHTNWSPAPTDFVSKSDFEALQAKVDLLTKKLE